MMQGCPSLGPVLWAAGILVPRAQRGAEAPEANISLGSATTG